MEDNKSDIIIEGSTALWEMKEEGEIQGTFTGTFRFRCFLTPTQKIAANREYRELLGANPTLASEHESYLAYCLSQLKQRVIDAPPFWTSSIKTSGYAGDIVDENVITAVLNASINAELKYKEQLKEKKSQVLERAKAAAERLLSQKDEDEEEDQETTD